MITIVNRHILLNFLYFNNSINFDIIITLVVIVILVVYLILDYIGPYEIPLKPDSIFGFLCLRAKELIVQEYDEYDNLWATRGMLIYQLKKNDTKFIRFAHIPTGFSIYWLRNFSILRKLSIRPECIEMVVSENGDICALSAGKIWLYSSDKKKFKETLQLSNYGFGDQGIRNDGIISIDNNTIFFGEYFRNPQRKKIRIYKSINNISTWVKVYEFEPGFIRHIHAIQKDPFTGKLWVLTGDSNNESMIAWSDDEFKTINQIGNGSQLWRVCQLIFTEEAIYWGTDTGNFNVSGIYRWDKKSKEIEILQKNDDITNFGTRLAKGTIVMSSYIIGGRNELDNRARILILTKDNRIKSINWGTWNNNKKLLGNKYAMLRLQRNQGGASLAITCLNQKEMPNGELIIVSEDALMAAK